MKGRNTEEEGRTEEERSDMKGGTTEEERCVKRKGVNVLGMNGRFLVLEIEALNPGIAPWRVWISGSDLFAPICFSYFGSIAFSRIWAQDTRDMPKLEVSIRLPAEAGPYFGG